MSTASPPTPAPPTPFPRVLRYLVWFAFGAALLVIPLYFVAVRKNPPSRRMALLVLIFAGIGGVALTVTRAVVGGVVRRPGRGADRVMARGMVWFFVGLLLGIGVTPVWYALTSRVDAPRELSRTWLLLALWPLSGVAMVLARGVARRHGWWPQVVVWAGSLSLMLTGLMIAAQ